MKKHILILSILIMSKLTYSQCDERFNVVVVNFNLKGAGFEVGKWHTTEQKWGHFYGAELRWAQTNVNKIGDTSTTPPSISAYYKIQRRIIDYVAITTSIGIQGFEKLYLGIGLRTYIPLHPTRKSILIFEPTYSTQGFKPTVGLAIAL